MKRASKFTLAKKHCPTFYFVRDCRYFYMNNSILFNEFVCKLGPFKTQGKERFKCARVPKRAQFTHERFFVRQAPLTSCDIYQNPFTLKKILKF
jgi:hypothetical protein